MFYILVNLQQTAGSPVGSLAYVIEEQALLVKVNSGWQYVLVSILFMLVRKIKLKNSTGVVDFEVA